MPCNSEYMNQTPAEQHNQLAAKLLVWLDDKGLACLTKQSRSNFEAQTTYYSIDNGQVKTLCALIDDLEDKRALEPLIKEYALDKIARQLADWVEDHKAQDVRRERAERDKIHSQKLAAASVAFANLTNEQLDNLLKNLTK